MSGKIGIYVGLFDPVHAGHIAFAIQATQEAQLDAVYFLPERMPTQKHPVEHYGHRVAMLERALKPHDDLAVIETADKRFTPAQTIPRLQSALGTQQFTFLHSLASWQRALVADESSVFHTQKFVVAVKDANEIAVATNLITQYNLPPKSVQFVDYLRSDVATEYVQLAIGHNKNAPGLLPSVVRYAKTEWLYAALPKTHRR